MSERRRAHRRDWETLGTIDPLYAILSDPAKKHERWGLEEFLATGQGDIDALLGTASRLGVPRRFGSALELGCGVGRLIRPLAARFDRCVGIDISEPMIERARDLNADLPNCTWIVNDADDLSVVADGSADLVLSSLVLQHVPTRSAILGYVTELVRVLAPGGLLAIQLPDVLPVRQRLQPRRRAFAVLRRTGVPERVLYNRLGLNPIRMSGVPRRDVCDAIVGAGGRLIDVELGWLGNRATTGREVNLTYLATKDG